jgi:hypothetical protein
MFCASILVFGLYFLSQNRNSEARPHRTADYSAVYSREQATLDAYKSKNGVNIPIDAKVCWLCGNFLKSEIFLNPIESS